MQAKWHRKSFTKWFIFIRGCFLKTMFENGFQKYYFTKYYSLILKGLISNPITTFAFMQASSFLNPQGLIKFLFYFEN
jgi:hypothetical protein